MKINKKLIEVALPLGRVLGPKERASLSPEGIKPYKEYGPIREILHQASQATEKRLRIGGRGVNPLILTDYYLSKIKKRPLEIVVSNQVPGWPGFQTGGTKYNNLTKEKYCLILMNLLK